MVSFREVALNSDKEQREYYEKLLHDACLSSESLEGGAAVYSGFLTLNRGGRLVLKKFGRPIRTEGAFLKEQKKEGFVIPEKELSYSWHLDPLDDIKKLYTASPADSVVTDSAPAPVDQLSEKEKKAPRADNIRRSRDLLIDLLSASRGCWRSFVTLTFADNITDINFAFKRLNSWLTSCRRKFGRFSYVGVLEFQKRGAVHFHIVTDLECGKHWEKQKKKITRSNKNGNYKELYYYDLFGWRDGFSSAFPLVGDEAGFDDNFNIALYMAKYLVKDTNDVRLAGKKKLFHSRGLPRSKKVYLPLNFNYSKFEKEFNISYFHIEARPGERFSCSVDVCEKWLDMAAVSRCCDFLKYGAVDVPQYFNKAWDDIQSWYAVVNLRRYLLEKGENICW